MLLLQEQNRVFLRINIGTEAATMKRPLWDAHVGGTTGESQEDVQIREGNRDLPKAEIHWYDGEV